MSRMPRQETKSRWFGVGRSFDDRDLPEVGSVEKHPERAAIRAYGCAVWFTGLPSSGKSTLARMLYRELRGGEVPAQVLDGDEFRQRLTRGLGFSRADRFENIRRIAYVSKLLVQVGAVAITAAITPYRDMRNEAREEIGSFIEVYVKCPLEVCMARDVKGLYRRARLGEIQHFTGVSDPYEPPTFPDVVLETARFSPADCLEQLLSQLAAHRYFPFSMGSVRLDSPRHALDDAFPTLGNTMLPRPIQRSSVKS